MQSRDADIVKSRHPIAEQLGAYRGFLGDRNVRGARADHHDRAVPDGLGTASTMTVAMRGVGQIFEARNFALQRARLVGREPRDDQVAAASSRTRAPIAAICSTVLFSPKTTSGTPRRMRAMRIELGEAEILEGQIA